MLYTNITTFEQFYIIPIELHYGNKTNEIFGMTDILVPVAAK